MEGDIDTIQTVTAQNRTTILKLQTRINELESNQFAIAEGINVTEQGLHTAIGDRPNYFDTVIIISCAMMVFTGFFFTTYLKGK